VILMVHMFWCGAVCRWRRHHACPAADNGGTTSLAAPYMISPALWGHTLLPATRRKCPA